MANIISCQQCNSQYDITSYQPGVQFACSKCGQIVQVPMQQAPVAAVQKRQRQAPISRQAKGRSRSDIREDRRSQLDFRYKRQKSNAPLVLIGLVVVVMLGIIVYFLVSGQDNNKSNNENVDDNKSSNVFKTIDEEKKSITKMSFLYKLGLRLKGAIVYLTKSEIISKVGKPNFIYIRNPESYKMWDIEIKGYGFEIWDYECKDGLCSIKLYSSMDRLSEMKDLFKKPGAVIGLTFNDPELAEKVSQFQKNNDIEGLNRLVDEYVTKTFGKNASNDLFEVIIFEEDKD